VNIFFALMERGRLLLFVHNPETPAKLISKLPELRRGN